MLESIIQYGGNTDGSQPNQVSESESVISWSSVIGFRSDCHGSHAHSSTCTPELENLAHVQNSSTISQCLKF